MNLPVALLQLALDTGMVLPQVSGNDALKNIDLRQVMELIHHGAIGNIFEVESANGDTVRLFVE